MSLLLKALQNAAKNREAAGIPESEAGAASESRLAGADELSLEPVQSNPRASGRPQPFNPEDSGERAAAPGPQQAQTVLRAGARREPPPARQPGVFSWLARRPLAAFSTAAGLFAVCYGVYLYFQITNPGMFVAQPSAPPPRVAAAPRPSEPPALSPLPPTAAQAPAPPLAGTLASPTTTLPTPPSLMESAAPARATAAAPATTERANPSSPTTPPSTQRSSAARGTPGAAPAAAPVDALAVARPGPSLSERTVPIRPSASPRSAGAPAVASGAASALATERTALRPRPAPRPAAAASPRPEGVAAASTIQVIPVDINVASGYRALEKGELDEAQRMYRQALATDPRSVDAMLGLASTLTQLHQADSASQLYLRVLEQDPRNAHAQAGLLNIAGRADPAAAEARLKQLIAREPSAFLYFTLGNLYSEQGQWAGAQSAYFQAHNLAPDNPDYAFNLAVGLEHLSQPRLALDYYRRAVALAQSRGHAQFERARVETRIRSLEATLAQQP